MYTFQKYWCWLRWLFVSSKSGWIEYFRIDYHRFISSALFPSLNLLFPHPINFLEYQNITSYRMKRHRIIDGFKPKPWRKRSGYSLLSTVVNSIGSVDRILAEFSICRPIQPITHRDFIDTIDRKWTNFGSWWFRILQNHQMWLINVPNPCRELSCR